MRVAVASGEEDPREHLAPGEEAIQEGIGPT